MANHKSARKRMRQTVRKTAQNARTKKSVRSYEKKVRRALLDGKKEELPQLLIQFESQVAKAAQKGVVHPRNMARRVSRLNQQANRLSAHSA